jgi:hypothetical protein
VDVEVVEECLRMKEGKRIEWILGERDQQFRHLSVEGVEDGSMIEGR